MHVMYSIAVTVACFSKTYDMKYVVEEKYKDKL